MSTELYLTNSLTRTKEKFESLTPGYVGLYVCGPTVSGESHLGHARPYITYDIVNRWLMHLGYKVRYVRNITDAGHFEEEGREAEDKISKRSALEKLEPMELITKYTRLFHWAMNLFNTIEPSIEPTATGHIVEQIEMIRDIMDKGYAYEVNGSVYFDVKKYAEAYKYGELSGRVIDELLETTRDLEGQDEKKNKTDFALWKAAPLEHLQRWASPWGEGFPGWHIECSAMSCKYLGKQFDIHGGGMDLLFPHHESEIAQSTIANNAAPVRYWMHNNMITIDGKKMGKSYNNVIKLTELFSGNHPLLAQAYHPMIVRFYILQTHYRSTLDFSNDALQAAEKGYARLWQAYEASSKLECGTDTTMALDDKQIQKIAELCITCRDYMNDDFNTAKVIGNLFELSSIVNSLKEGHIAMASIGKEALNTIKETMHTYIVDVLGLTAMQVKQDSKLDGVVHMLIEMRKAAKLRKDYAASDAIRNDLLALGIQLKDEKDGAVSFTLN
jgi:cysteinyl-tRNA synthetase